MIEKEEKLVFGLSAALPLKHNGRKKERGGEREREGRERERGKRFPRDFISLHFLRLHKREGEM